MHFEMFAKVLVLAMSSFNKLFKLYSLELVSMAFVMEVGSKDITSETNFNCRNTKDTLC